MSNSGSSTTISGIGFFGLLTIALVVLKIIGYGEYSWWIAFSPIFIAIALFSAIVVFVLLFIYIAEKF